MITWSCVLLQGLMSVSDTALVVEQLLEAKKALRSASSTVSNCMQALRGDLDTIVQQVVSSLLLFCAWILQCSR